MNNNDYENQKLRGLKRKYEMIQSKGGQCEICGYNKNISALDFHHIDPKNKEFQLDIRHLSNTSLDKIKKELDKCQLLCANCHRETHYRDLTMSNISNIIKKAEDKLSFSNNIQYKHICKVCKQPIKNYTSGKIYCSESCRWKDKNYPTLEEILKQYDLLGTWDKVAQYFGLSRKVIQGICKRNS